MINIEKVIKGLEACVSSKECSQNDCPYYEHGPAGICFNLLATDALTLLKEQEEQIARLSTGIETLRKKLEETVLGV